MHQEIKMYKYQGLNRRRGLDLVPVARCEPSWRRGGFLLSVAGITVRCWRQLATGAVNWMGKEMVISDYHLCGSVRGVVLSRLLD